MALKLVVLKDQQYQVFEYSMKDLNNVGKVQRLLDELIAAKRAGADHYFINDDQVDRFVGRAREATR